MLPWQTNSIFINVLSFIQIKPSNIRIARSKR